MKISMLIMVIATVVYATLNVTASANTPQQRAYIPNQEKVGEARYKVLFWKVFDATLYAPDGTYNRDEPFVLALSYLRKIRGEQIVERSISEIAQQGKASTDELAQWRDQLLDIIPDVDKSSTISGVRTAQGTTEFFLNGSPIGTVSDVRFTPLFFDIWLGEGSANAKFRKDLLEG
ncbi:MAG: chalcone isomerase family protein [Pseudomonadota bacterium]